MEATHELLLAARNAKVRRVVLASSSSVYGDSDTLPKREALRPAPVSPYAVHKLVGEHYAALFHRLYGLETVALRFFNVFGPRQAPGSRYAAVISHFTAALLAGRPATIHGDGEQTRDFTYVTDTVLGTLQACTAPAAAGRVINVACGRRASVNAIYAILQRIIGVSVPPRYTDPRVGDVRHTLADLSIAREALGYAPEVSLEDGLRRTVAWQRGSGRRRAVRGSDSRTREGTRPLRSGTGVGTRVVPSFPGHDGRVPRPVAVHDHAALHGGAHLGPVRLFPEVFVGQDH